jgi:hypothetical protein
MADTRQFTPGSRSRGGPGSVRTGDTRGVDAGQLIESAKNMGSQMIGAVQETATSVLDDQKKRAADQIATIADMLRDSVKSLDPQSAGTVRQYADDAARQIADVADRLRTRSWGQLAGDVEDFGRRWPTVFIASAIATGFITGRFLVASASRPRETPASTTQTTSGMADQPRGGARYDYGPVSGPVSGSGNSGYGSVGKETP